jgi:soluble lytic murein transglycosylase-like protein
MLQKTIIVLMLAFTSKFAIANAVTTVDMGLFVPKLTKVERNDITRIIERKAFSYGLNPILMAEIIQCESSFNPNAKNISTREESYGLVQINTLVHDVTIEQATNPEFAVEFLAKHLKEGKGDKMWVTCYAKATGKV